MFQNVHLLTVKQFGTFEVSGVVDVRLQRSAWFQHTHHVHRVEMRALQAFSTKVIQLNGFNDLGSNHSLVQACLLLDPKRPSSSMAFVSDHTHQTHGAFDQRDELLP